LNYQRRKKEQGEEMKKVIVIEDNAILRKALKRVFRGSEFDVSFYPNTEEAMFSLGDLFPDIFITDNDLGLGHKRGCDFARTMSGKVPVIVMSAEDVRAEAKTAGAIAFLFKTDGLDGIPKMIREHLPEE